MYAVQYKLSLWPVFLAQAMFVLHHASTRLGT